MAEYVQIAVLGCGYWGKNLVRNFHALNALGLVCDQSAAARQSAEGLAPGIPTASDERAVWDSDVRGVVIATPAATHFELACQALEAGKDVFVEKPLALSYGEGHHLVNLAGAARSILMVGHVLEYHPAVAALATLVRKGELGRIQYIYSHRLSLGKIRREENILWSFAPHDIAIILRLVGDLPFEVTACGGSYLQPNIPDVTVTQLLFDNGIRAHIYVSWLHPFKEQRLVVIGTRRMASFDDVSKKLLIYDQRVDIRDGEPVPVRGDGREHRFSGDEPLRLECQAFLESIATRRPPLTDGQSGLRVLQVLQMAQRSLVLNGEPVAERRCWHEQRGHICASDRTG